MKIFFAGMAESQLNIPKEEFDKLNCLVAYPQLKRQKTTPKKHWFIDSGAFSVFTGKEEVDINEYIKDLINWNCEVYAGLDVIGDEKQTKSNCDIMKKAGLDPIPTFHFGEDYSFLEDYCKNYDYIALGGVAQLRTYPRVSAWLDNCFSVIKNYWPKKVHGFAITGERYMKRYPFYSADSTSWLAGAKFNQVAGVKDSSMYRPLHYTERNLKNIKHFLKLENEVTKLWEKKGVKWE